MGIPENASILGYFTVKTVKNGYFTVIPRDSEVVLKLPEYPLTLVPESQRELIKEGAGGQIALIGDTTVFRFEF